MPVISMKFSIEGIGDNAVIWIALLFNVPLFCCSNAYLSHQLGVPQEASISILSLNLNYSFIFMVWNDFEGE